jgi:uncharacterized protein YjcR
MSDVIIPRKKGGRPSKRPTAYELSVMYRFMTSVEIAKKYDVSPATVRSWLCRYRKEIEENG